MIWGKSNIFTLGRWNSKPPAKSNRSHNSEPYTGDTLEKISVNMFSAVSGAQVHTAFSRYTADLEKKWVIIFFCWTSI
jgi:hypothetical protein